MLILPIKIDTEDADKSVQSWIKKTSEKSVIKPKVKLEGAWKDLFDGATSFNKAVKVGTDLLSNYSSYLSDAGLVSEEVAGHLANAADQTASWAAKGAVVGSIFPGIGTAIGGAVGGLASAVSLTYDWWTGTKQVAEQTAEVVRLKKLENIENKEQAEAYERVKKIWADQIEQQDASKQLASELSAGIKKIAEDSEKIDDSWQGIADNSKEATESISDWLDRTYTAALQARSEIEALNKSVIDLMGSESERLAKKISRDAQERGVGGEGVRGIERDIEAREIDPLAGVKSAIAKEETDRLKRELQERADAYEGYFSLVTGFLGNFTDQLEENIAQGNGLFEGMGLAAQRGVAEVLKALGKKWGAEAISELAAGFAALATPGMRQDAPGHFTSAALYGSAAAAAGIAGAAVGGSAARQANEQQAGGGVQSPRLTDPGTQNMGTINYYSGGGPGSTTIYAGDSEREKQKARKELEGILNVGKPK